MLGVYLYLLLYLQRLWTALSALPARLPDGVPLDERAYPWLLNSLIRKYFAKLSGVKRRQNCAALREEPYTPPRIEGSDHRRPLIGIERLVTVLIAWWLVLLTLFGFWLRYLPRQDRLGTILHVLVLLLALVFCCSSYRRAMKTLEDRSPFPENEPDLLEAEHRERAKLVPGEQGQQSQTGTEPQGRSSILGPTKWAQLWARTKKHVKNAFSRPKWPAAVAFSTMILVLIGTYIAFFHPTGPHDWELGQSNGSPAWIAQASHYQEKFGARIYGTSANFLDADISTKPQNWLQLIAQSSSVIAQVKGADLRRSNLRHAYARGTFLINANLEEANLEGADLRRSDLRGANLSRAKLRGAKLAGADLSAADLSGADVLPSDLSGACGDSKTKLPQGMSIDPCPGKSEVVQQ
jgi:hypothetical protein